MSVTLEHHLSLIRALESGLVVQWGSFCSSKLCTPHSELRLHEDRFLAAVVLQTTLARRSKAEHLAATALLHAAAGCNPWTAARHCKAWHGSTTTLIPLPPAAITAALKTVSWSTPTASTATSRPDQLY